MMESRETRNSSDLNARTQKIHFLNCITDYKYRETNINSLNNMPNEMKLRTSTDNIKGYSV